MPIRVTLRTSQDFSPFRELLHRVIALPNCDKLILCSGYIWEPSGQGYTVLNDELLDKLKSGCAGQEIIIVAGKLDGFWPEHYQNFVRRLRQSGLQVKAYVAPRRNWHAKIAIRIRNQQPIAALIGSSNLTGPAYGENRYRWNFESDVLIWKNSPDLNEYFQRPFQADIPFGDMQLVLNPDIPQMNELEHLQGIYEDIINNDFEELSLE